MTVKEKFQAVLFMGILIGGLLIGGWLDGGYSVHGIVTAVEGDNVYVEVGGKEWTFKGENWTVDDNVVVRFSNNGTNSTKDDTIVKIKKRR